MLEHVALNQTRFHTPGVAPDTRGVVLGKLGAVLFPAVDKLVGFFAMLSDELPLDDLLPTLRITEIRTPLKSREFLVLFHATSSYLMDRAARVARFLGGLAFTGTQKHFVKFRDDASPLGYDVDQLSADPADFILYSDSFTQAASRVRELPFSQLVFRLSLRRLPGGDKAARIEAGDRDVLWLTVPRGLAKSLVTYLWRNRVPVAATLVERQGQGTTFGHDPGYLLARVGHLPDRMLDLFVKVPGVEVHRPLGENVAVQLGWRHPLRLEACQTIFEKERFYIFSGARDTVEVIAGPPPLVSGERLLTAGFDLGEEREKGGKGAPLSSPMRVELRLVPSVVPPRRVTATLVPWSRADWLKKLVFTLPPTVLSGYRVAPVDDGLLVVGRQGVDGLPIGELLQEAAASIYVPVGFEFLPRVSESVLTDHVGGVAGRVVVFRRGEPAPFAVPDDGFEPLGRLEIDMRSRSERLPVAVTPPDAVVRNEPLGPLPLWGFRGGKPPDLEP